MEKKVKQYWNKTFFKQQECTGRWISVESEAVCKTAKIQTEMTYFLRDGCSTRGHIGCHGSQYKLESKSEMYCAREARPGNQPPPPVQIQPRLQTAREELQKFLSAPLAHLSFI